MAKNLIRKGNALYCRVTIPRPLRQYFLNEAGKPRDAIWETLGPDYTVAKPKCAERVAYWEGVFARLRAGESLDDIRAADEREQAEARERERVGRLWTDPNLAPDEVTAAMDTLRKRLAQLSARPAVVAVPFEIRPAPAVAPVATTSETVSQAAAALYGALERDKRRRTT